MKTLLSACLALTVAGSFAAMAAPEAAPDSIQIFFRPGSSGIAPVEAAKLDQAARLYREGKPLLMTVSGATDSTGDAVANLHISQKRADAVFSGLVARGIPAERFQIIAKGETQPAVQTDNGVAEQKNREAVITWK